MIKVQKRKDSLIDLHEAVFKTMLGEANSPNEKQEYYDTLITKLRDPEFLEDDPKARRYLDSLLDKLEHDLEDNLDDDNYIEVKIRRFLADYGEPEGLPAFPGDLDEEEQIDELDKRTLGSYVKAAGRDMGDQIGKLTRATMSTALNKDSEGKYGDVIANAKRSYGNRATGMVRAVNKLTEDDMNDYYEDFIERLRDPAVLKNEPMGRKRLDSLISQLEGELEIGGDPRRVEVKIRDVLETYGSEEDLEEGILDTIRGVASGVKAGVQTAAAGVKQGIATGVQTAQEKMASVKARKQAAETKMNLGKIILDLQRMDQTLASQGPWGKSIQNVNGELRNAIIKWNNNMKLQNLVEDTEEQLDEAIDMDALRRIAKNTLGVDIAGDGKKQIPISSTNLELALTNAFRVGAKSVFEAVEDSGPGEKTIKPAVQSIITSFFGKEIKPRLLSTPNAVKAALIAAYQSGMSATHKMKMNAPQYGTA